MNTTTVDMTEGNIYRHIIKFTIPIFLSQLFQQLYNTADTYIVGKFLGTEALAAVSSSGTLIFLLISFFTGLSTGASIVISKFFGADDKDRVSRAVHTTVAFGIVCGIILTVVGVLFTPTFLKWMNTDKDILPKACEYFRFYFTGGLAFVLYNCATGIMNAVGDSKRPLYYLVFSSVLNVILDILFVGVFRFNVWSAAIATVISQVASVILCFIQFAKKGNIYSLKLSKLRFYKDMFTLILKVGVPSGVQNSVIGFANVIVNSQINTFGKFATAAYGSYSKIEGFVFLPISSFTMAISTFVSQNLGAGKFSRVKKGAKFCIIASMAFAEIIGIICFIFAPHLIAVFDNTPAVIEYGTLQIHTVSLFYMLLAFSHSVASICRGAGKAFVPMLVMLSVWCIFRVAYIMTVMKLFNKLGLIYLAYPITWSISSVIFFIYYKFSNWMKEKA